MKICMLTSSYPKYEGDVTAPFIESIAANIAALGHDVHLLAPYHPDVRREPVEKGVHLHFFKYSPVRDWNIWGYAESLEADVRVKGVIYPLTPVVFASSMLELRRLTSEIKFDIMHAHWVIPNGPMAAIVARLRGLPLIVSMHGSDVFVAAQSKPVSSVARWCFRRAQRRPAQARCRHRRAGRAMPPRAVRRGPRPVRTHGRRGPAPEARAWPARRFARGVRRRPHGVQEGV